MDCNAPFHLGNRDDNNELQFQFLSMSYRDTTIGDKVFLHLVSVLITGADGVVKVTHRQLCLCSCVRTYLI